VIYKTLEYTWYFDPTVRRISKEKYCWIIWPESMESHLHKRRLPSCSVSFG